MAKEKFVLLSLQEDKAKKLAQVISNESCRRILDHLADKDATATELSKAVGAPLSTVHYNIKHLTDAGLVVCEEFHFSPKGKEVNHYKLASKYIIIAPQGAAESEGFAEKLRALLPVVGIVGAGALALQFGQRFFFGAQQSVPFTTEEAASLVVPAAEPLAKAIPFAAQAPLTDAAEAGVMMMQERAADTAPALAEPIVDEFAVRAPDAITTVAAAHAPWWTSIALWFVVGAVVALALFFVFRRIFRKR